MLCLGHWIQVQGASGLCGTQCQAQLLVLTLFQMVCAVPELLAVTREWHCLHHLLKEQWSRLVTPRYSQAGNRTSSHHSHTSTHYTVKQKYLYFPRWLQSFLMPLTPNHVLCYYLRKTPNTRLAGTAAWYGLAWPGVSRTMCSYGQLGLLGKACHSHHRPRLCSTSLSLMNVKLSPNPLAESNCVSDLKWAGTTPMS